MLNEVLAPLLRRLGNAPQAAHAWVRSVTGPVIAGFSIQELQPIASSVCLFYYRTGIGQEFNQWLAKFTKSGDSDAAGPVHAELALHEIRIGNLLHAESILKKLQSGPDRDRVLETFIPAMAKEAPIQAGKWLDDFYTIAKQAGIGTQLMNNPEFIREPANIYRLMIILEDDPEKLGKLVSIMLSMNSLANLTDELIEVFNPTERGTISLSEAVHAFQDVLSGKAGTGILCKLLDHNLVDDLVDAPKRLKAFREKVKSDSNSLEQILIRGLAVRLQEEGLLDSKQIEKFINQFTAAKNQQAKSNIVTSKRELRLRVNDRKPSSATHGTTGTGRNAT
jgi:hypothetical protein